MGAIRTPIPVKLFTGILSSERALFDECTRILSAEFGPVDYASGDMPWDMTDYYRDEMGDGLFRRFVFFKELADPGLLSAVKVFSNNIEKCFSVKTPSGERRRINLDPGYVSEAKVVLATTKDYAHRIYIGNNIYAEVTLRYSSKENSFTDCDYTYFDFRTGSYKALFNAAREKLREELRRSEKK